MSYLEEVLAERDRLRAERAASVEMLRVECAAYDDNDWTDNLHLADIIEKHLARNAREVIRLDREKIAELLGALEELTSVMEGLLSE